MVNHKNVALNLLMKIYFFSFKKMGNVQALKYINCLYLEDYFWDNQISNKTWDDINQEKWKPAYNESTHYSPKGLCSFLFFGKFSNLKSKLVLDLFLHDLIYKANLLD